MNKNPFTKIFNGELVRKSCSKWLSGDVETNPGPVGEVLCLLQYDSLTSHTLHREKESGSAATIKLSQQQKLDVINQIRALHRSHLLSWGSKYITTCLADVSILLSVTFDNCVPRWQLDGSA